MSEHDRRKWSFYVDDMIAFADKALVYTEDLDQAGFVENGLIYDVPCAISN